MEDNPLKPLSLSRTEVKRRLGLAADTLTGTNDYLAEAEDFICRNRVLLEDPTTGPDVFSRLAEEAATEIESVGSALQHAIESPEEIGALELHERRVAFEELKRFIQEITEEFDRRFTPGGSEPEQGAYTPSIWRRLFG